MIKTALIVFGIAVPLLGATTTTGTYRNAPSVGVQAGVNFESASSPADISTETYTGFTAGVNGEIPLAENISIQPELNYSRRGFNLFDVGGLRTDVYYHSIELPIFGKVSVGEDVRFSAFAGPMGVWNVSTEVKASTGASTASTTFDPKTFDVAAVGGLGVDVGNFFANARYSLGILDIDDTSAEWRSRGFKVLAGVKF